MWTPREVRKLIAQCAGVLFGIGGILLMVADVKATGKINISTNLVSGQIESGSAGLLLLFFAFFLVLIPAFQGRHTDPIPKKASKSNTKSKSLTTVQKDIIICLVTTLLTTTFFIGGQQLGLNGYTGFSNLLIIGGYCFGAFTGLVIIGTIFDFADDGQNIKESKEEKKETN